MSYEKAQPANWIKTFHIGTTEVKVSDKGAVRIGNVSIPPFVAQVLLEAPATLREALQESVKISTERKKEKESQKFQMSLARQAEKFAAMGDGYLEALLQEAERRRAERQGK
jgi:hypothetical protein